MDVQQGLKVAGEVVAFLTALTTFLGTVRNGLTHLGWISTDEATKFGKFLDRMAWVAQKGSAGLATLPGYASKPAAPAPLAAVPPTRGDKGAADAKAIVGVSALSLAFLLLVLAGILLSGCATSQTKAGDTSAQKVQQDVAALQTIAKDVEAKCGPQFAPFAPLFASALAVAADPYNALADIMAAVAAIPALAQDYKGAACVVQTIRDDFRAQFPRAPKADRTVENADAVVELLLGMSAPDMACASR